MSVISRVESALIDLEKNTGKKSSSIYLGIETKDELVKEIYEQSLF